MTNEEYAVAIKAGHTEYITPLWENNQRLLSRICGEWWRLFDERFTQCGVTYDDLVQESFFALLQAAAAYDSSTGFKLTSYLSYPIKNRFNTLLGYRVSRNNPLNNCFSLDTPIGENEDVDIIELTPDPYSEKPFEQIEQDDYAAYWRAQLDGAMQRKLDRQQKDIVYDFYFLRLPKEVIAEKYGLPRGEVNNILRISLRDLRGDYELRMRYRDEIILDGLYKSTGLGAYRNSQISAVERSVETIERKTAELQDKNRSAPLFDSINSVAVTAAPKGA